MFSEEDKLVVVYSFHQETKEYVGSFEYFWSKGTGLAANTTLTPVPATNFGCVQVWNGENWIETEDNRKAIVYSVSTQVGEEITYLGPVKDGYTKVQPASKYQVWTGNNWVDPRTLEEITLDEAKELPSLTRRQFKLALLENDLLGLVSQKISEIPDPMIQARLQIEYEETTSFERSNPSISLLLSALGLSTSQVNEMWSRALTY